MFDFSSLDTLLAAHRPWWQPAPFRDSLLPWAERLPAARQALESLSDQDYQALRHDDGEARRWLCRWFPDMDQLARFVEPSAPALPADYLEPAHVPGRKAAQVACFCDQLAPSSHRLVEWCAGQGWLLEAALKQFPDLEGLGLEWQARLCRQGEARIRAGGLQASLQHCDVMAAASVTLDHEDTVLALHACGHLHQRLIEVAIEQAPRRLHLSPCCYHLGQPRALSGLGRRASLPAAEVDRHLAVQDITTGHSNRSKRNEKASAWRLGYDALRRHLLNDNRYRPLKSLPGRVWQGSFEEFAVLAAELHQLALPSQVDWQHWLETGQAEHRRIRRLELPRRQYRRLLEWWLVLDAAAALEENGYQVSTGVFCPGHMTPRNLIIHAWRDRQ